RNAIPTGLRQQRGSMGVAGGFCCSAFRLLKAYSASLVSPLITSLTTLKWGREMPYKVELPPNIGNSTKEDESSSGLSVLKITGESGDCGNAITEGPIVAVKIASTVLAADIWLAFKDDFKPDEGEPLAVFYADEIRIVAQKTPEQLREIHKVKLVFPGCRVIQEGPEAKS